MDEFEKKDIASKLVDRCPFCFKSEDVEWTEFKVGFVEYHYMDKQVLNRNTADFEIKVFCTRCKEEVLDNDF